MKQTTDRRIDDFVVNIGQEMGINCIDATTANRVLDFFSNYIQDKKGNIALDMSNIEFLNSTGLGILLHLNNTVKREEYDFAIFGVNDKIYQLIEIIGAVELMNVYSDRNAYESRNN